MLTRVTLTERQPKPHQDPDGYYTTGRVDRESDVSDAGRVGMQRVRCSRDDRSDSITVIVEAYGSVSLAALKATALRRLELERDRANKLAQSSMYGRKSGKIRQGNADDYNHTAHRRIEEILAEADPEIDTKTKAAEIVLSEDTDDWYKLGKDKQDQEVDNLLHRIAAWKRKKRKLKK